MELLNKKCLHVEVGEEFFMFLLIMRDLESNLMEFCSVISSVVKSELHFL